MTKWNPRYSDTRNYYAQQIRNMEQHAKDTGHCVEFREQCENELPDMRAKLAEIDRKIAEES